MVHAQKLKTPGVQGGLEAPTASEGIPLLSQSPEVVPEIGGSFKRGLGLL